MKLGCSSVYSTRSTFTVRYSTFPGPVMKGPSCDYGSHCRHIELITKQSYVDEIKWTAKKHNLGLFAIHAMSDSGRAKIKSNQCRPVRPGG